MSQDFSLKFDNIENKLEELQKDMEEIQSLLAEIKSDLLKKYGKVYLKKSSRRKRKPDILDITTKWKREIYGQIKLLLNMNDNFRKRSEVLHYIYNYMRKTYGIVWEQDIKEYKQKYKLDYKPKTIDIVYDNETYKSIFESILFDLIANTQKK